MGCSMRWRSSSLICRSFADRRSRRLLRRIWNRPLPGPPADRGEAKKIERFRFAEPQLGTLRRCEAAERDQPGLLRMQCQCKLCQPLAHHVEKASAVGLVLEADHDVVRITTDHHVASTLAPSPARRPEIED